jgi:hypothetical protein
MFAIWLILGSLMILLGIFNKRMLNLLGLKPLSEIYSSPSLKRSSRQIEIIGRWLVIVLGIAFLVQGLHGALPAAWGSMTSSALVGLSVLLLLTMFGIAMLNWKAR